MAIKAFEQMVRHVRMRGTRLTKVEAESTIGMRIFDVYAVQDDLFLLQREDAELDSKKTVKGIGARRRPVVLIQKSHLKIGKKGWVFAVGTGNFGSILTPLFSGDLGETLCRVPKSKCSSVLQYKVVLANLTRRGIELLQRDTEFPILRAADEWLQLHGYGLDEITYCERTAAALETMETLGQVWRVRPRVYTVEEMREAIGCVWQRREAGTHYFVSVRGVHWLVYPEFCRVVERVRRSSRQALACLREWVALTAGETKCALRRQKYPGRHVIEFFGLSRDAMEHLILPALERLLEGLTLGRMDAEDVADTLEGIGRLYKQLLEFPQALDLDSPETIQQLYALISDDLTMGEGHIDFDARRIALPGVTFRNGVPHPHPGVDRQTLTIVDHLVGRLSLNEHAEFINVYDVRSAKKLASGSGQSREIVLKTDRIPVPISFIQKRLGSVRAGYANYMLTRANVFRALGAEYPNFQLLSVVSHGQQREETPYFLRTRCPGDPLSAIPPELFRSDPSNPQGAESPEVVLALAELFGSAAAQNLVVKKYLPGENPTCRFGQDKEIFEFVYDPFMHRPMPSRVQVCSIRGTMGWPSLAQNSTNLRDFHRFYLKAYAAVAGNYWRSHAEACTLNECTSAFFDGFERKIEAMFWTYQTHQKHFDTFDPALRPIYNFRAKLDFALWALARSAKDLAPLREYFMDYVRDFFVKV